jgi:hypothetical protein
MKCFSLKALCFCIMLTSTAFSQPVKRQLPAKRINTVIKIDGVLQPGKMHRVLISLLPCAQPLLFPNPREMHQRFIFYMIMTASMLADIYMKKTKTA